jgi:hypothetical protein
MALGPSTRRQAGVPCAPARLGTAVPLVRHSQPRWRHLPGTVLPRPRPDSNRGWAVVAWPYDGPLTVVQRADNNHGESWASTAVEMGLMRKAHMTSY